MPARNTTTAPIEAPAAPPLAEDPAQRVQLWQVEMPARGEYAATKVGIYVQNDQVTNTIGGFNWAVWQPWNAKVKPWLAKRGGRGKLLAPGERLAI